MAIVLTATMLWGGCLSCSQYFMFPMFPTARAKSCCLPSGGCKDKPAKSSSQAECVIQAMAPAKAPAVPLSSFTVLPASAPVLRVAARLDARRDDGPSHQTSPPDLFLLHSVFRI
jgi:hypothetical protein